MTHNERKHNCFCSVCGAPAAKGYIVRFGREISKRFSSYAEAAQFLSGLRFKTAEGSLDPRDYRADNPLAFKTQADKWLDIKEGSVSRSHYLSLKRYIIQAVEVIGKEKNVKHISYGDVEDFLLAVKKQWSDKTRANARSALHDFFQWLKQREGVSPPDMPEVKFDLGWRKITTLDIQRKILEEIDRIAPSKVAFGVEMLATYPSLRPDDLLRVDESDLVNNILTLHNPSKLKNKFKHIRLLPEHVQKWQKLCLSIPSIGHVKFFRHQTTQKGCRKDDPYGKRYFYKWWIKACDNLGIEGLDLYGGTRHTTTTAIADLADELSAKKASGHMTNKAFERYCQSADQTAFKMANLVSKKPVQQVYNLEDKKKNPVTS